jgi:hypothetical protein
MARVTSAAARRPWSGPGLTGGPGRLAGGKLAASDQWADLDSDDRMARATGFNLKFYPLRPGPGPGLAAGGASESDLCRKHRLAPGRPDSERTDTRSIRYRLPGPVTVTAGDASHGGPSPADSDTVPVTVTLRRLARPAAQQRDDWISEFAVEPGGPAGIASMPTTSVLRVCLLTCAVGFAFSSSAALCRGRPNLCLRGGLQSFLLVHHQNLRLEFSRTLFC